MCIIKRKENKVSVNNILAKRTLEYSNAANKPANRADFSTNSIVPTLYVAIHVKDPIRSWHKMGIYSLYPKRAYRDARKNG